MKRLIILASTFALALLVPALAAAGFWLPTLYSAKVLALQIAPLEGANLCPYLSDDALQALSVTTVSQCKQDLRLQAPSSAEVDVDEALEAAWHGLRSGTYYHPGSYRSIPQMKKEIRDWSNGAIVRVGGERQAAKSLEPDAVYIDSASDAHHVILYARAEDGIVWKLASTPSVKFVPNEAVAGKSRPYNQYAGGRVAITSAALDSGGSCSVTVTITTADGVKKDRLFIFVPRPNAGWRLTSPYV